MAEMLSTEQETHIVALLARGDTYKDITAQMNDKFNRPVDKMTIVNVKKRNAGNLSLIKEKQLQKALNDAQAIKDSTNTLISKQISQATKVQERIEQAHKDFKEGNIDIEELDRIVKLSKLPTLPELVSVSKEMYNQAQSDDKPLERKDMSALAEALKSGDEIALNQILIKKA